MSEIRAKKFGYTVHVDVDAQGRPHCPCGCGQVMAEVSPGVFQCPDGLAIQNAVREALASIGVERLIDGLLGPEAL